jgi:hypothetical protein
MIKYFLSCLAFLAVTANAQVMTPAEAHKEVDKICDKGCIVLSPQEIAVFQAHVNEFIQSQGQLAYQAGTEEGFKAGVEAAKNNPKVCPKNI